MLRLSSCFLLTVVAVASQDLKTIFRTPKRNYDEFEILERSNFDSDNSGTPTRTDRPKNFANAQVLLRFGGDKDQGCNCGNCCQCKNPPYPYIPVPYCLYIPYFYPQQQTTPQVTTPPPTTTVEPTTEEKIENSENVVDETSTEVKNTHPLILDTVQLPEEVVKPVEEIEQCLKEVSEKIEPKEVSPNVKFVALDLSRIPKITKNDIRELDNSLVPYSGMGQTRPKYLVTHPIFNRPSDVIVPPLAPSRVPFETGFGYSEGSFYYNDPMRSVVYRKPSVLSILGPQNVKYMVVPVSEPVVRVGEHGDGCCCCNCAKYAGELNENAI